MASHKYENLADPQRFIRVLELLPGDSSSPLHFNFQIIDTNQAQQSANSPRPIAPADFEALSYTWGENVFPHEITHKASGGKIPITANLFEALQVLRFQDRRRRLWIDAVCINQKDDDEKSQQISQMGRIYRNASQVIVWLGNYDCRKGFRILQELADSSEEYGLEGFDMITGRHSVSKQAVEKGAEFCKDVDGKELEKCFSRDWYFRVWTLQEFCLASDARIYAGESSISYQDFFKAIFVLKLFLAPSGDLIINRLRENISLAGVLTAHLRAWDRLQMRECYAKHLPLSGGDLQLTSSSRSPLIRQLASYHPPPKRSIFYRPNLFRNCVNRTSAALRCSNELDCVYSVLAISKDGSKITPDYRITPSELWRQVSEQTLLSGDLSVLHFAGMDLSGLTREPQSWVANLGLSYKAPSRAPFGGTGRPDFVAGMAPLRSASVRVHEDILLLQGVLLDEVVESEFLDIQDSMTGEIAKIDPLDVPFRILLKTVVPMLYFWFNEWESSTQDWPYKDPRPYAFARTLIADQLMEDTRALWSVRSREGIVAFFLWVLGCCLNEVDNTGKFILDAPLFMSEKSPFDHEEVQTWQRFLSFMFSRGRGKAVHFDKETGQSKVGLEISGIFETEMRKYLNAVWNLVATRALFQTSHGYLGLGPRRTDKRDIVVVFDGSETPFVLRPTGESLSTKDGEGNEVDVPVYRLVGECYLHGWMGGEAFDPKFEGSKGRTFALR